MSLIVLTFLACLGDRCQAVQIPFDGGLQACMLFGGHVAAEWVSQRPGYALQRGWRCETDTPT